MDLKELQIQTEKECLQTGLQTYRNRIKHLQETGNESISKPSVHLLQTFVADVANKIIERGIESRKKPGPCVSAIRMLEEGDSEGIALITLRCVLNAVCSVPTIQSISRTLGNEIEFELKMQALEKHHEPAYKRLKHQLATSPALFQGIRGKSVMKSAVKRYDIKWTDWTYAEKLRVGIFLLDCCIEATGLVMPYSYREDSLMFRTVIGATPAYVEWVERQHQIAQFFHLPRVPMVVPPQKFTKMDDGGYLTDPMRIKLFKAHPFVVPEGYTSKTMPVVFNAVNAVQEVPYRVNEKVFEVVLGMWNKGHAIPGAAARHDAELPEKPHDFDTNPRSARHWKRTTREIMVANFNARGQRVAVTQILSLASRFKGKDFYFPHHLDFRGRMYSAVSFLSPQGSDLSKGLIHFARSKALGTTGLRWLKIHVANSYGVDKVSFDERVKWVDEHLQEIKHVGTDPLESSFWYKADSPCVFLAACIELAAALASPDPCRYESSIPIGQDGSCNGIQHLAALSRDYDAGASVNLVPLPKPADIYAEVARVATELTKECLTGPEPKWYYRSDKTRKAANDRYKELLKGSAKLGSMPPPPIKQIAKDWLGWGITRQLTKRPTMVQPYNGTMSSVEKYVEIWVNDNLDLPYESVQHRFKLSYVRFMSRVIWEALSRVIVGPRSLMQWTRTVAKDDSKDGNEIVWTTPAGFKVVQAYKKQNKREIVTRTGLKVRVNKTDPRIRMLTWEDINDIDARRQAQAMSPNWIHSLDAAALQLTICRLKEAGIVDIMAVHDSYGCHACDCDEMARILRQEFVKMYEADPLQKFYEELKGKCPGIPPPPPKGTLDIRQVLNSPYFFA
jgi:DNA-directed RNA polymerase